MQTERPRETDPGFSAVGIHPTASSTAERSPGLLGVRRRFLVDYRSQIRAGLLTTGATLILLVLLNISLYSSREQSTARILADAPELASMLRSQNALEFALILASSLVFLIGVFVVTVLETHKTAGAALNLRRHMNCVRQGQYNARIHLRRDDTLVPLGKSFNDMTTALEARVWQEVEALERFADRAVMLTGPGDAEDLSREIRTRAQEHRRLVE